MVGDDEHFDLRRTFDDSAIQYADRGALLLRQGEPAVVLILSGMAYCAQALPDQQQAIVDLLVPGDIAGLDQSILPRPDEHVVAAGHVSYRAITGARVRTLLANPQMALQVCTVLTEASSRARRLALSIARHEAEARIGAFLLDIYDRLSRRGPIDQPAFPLPLTQAQIADHLGLTGVHVNRTLRQLREDRLALIERGWATIHDIRGLRDLVLAA